MERENRTKLTRTRFPVKITNKAKKITHDEIMEFISNSDKARLLNIQTEIQAR